MGNRKTKIVAGAIGLLVLAGGLHFLAPRENDPIYKGKRLSEYLLAFETCGLLHGGGIIGGELQLDPGVRPQFVDPLALEAVSAIGTNALPLLVRMLATKDSRLANWIRSVVEKHAVLKKLLPTKTRTAETSRIVAVVAFHVLEARAASFAPEISRLFDDPCCAFPAIFAFMSVRPEVKEHILSLTNVLGLRKFSAPVGPTRFLHSDAILALSTFGSKASNAAPIIMDTLRRSPDARVRAASAVALARIGAPAEDVVPQIITNLVKTQSPRARTVGDNPG